MGGNHVMTKSMLVMLFIYIQFVAKAQTNEFNYPIAPTTNSSINAPVGSIADDFNVSATGGATYSMSIEAPKGIADSEPSLGIVYNSQSGNGIVGWGCNITGFSAITRMPTDIYHDGSASGFPHGKEGPFCLDGQRLIQYGGIINGDSLLFYPEFSPKTQVILHGLSSSSQTSMWFSVHAEDGKDYEYGHTANSQQTYMINGATKVNAWYVNKSRTPSCITNDYTYLKLNNYVYPRCIYYGNNTVLIDYELRPDTIKSAIEGIPVLITQRVSSIKTSSNVNNQESIFRRYTLNYTSTDQATTSYSRLDSVVVRNGDNESLRPTTLTWSRPSAYNCQKQSPTIGLTDMGTQRSSISICGADVDGDGLSDIVQMGTDNYYNRYIRVHKAGYSATSGISFTPGLMHLIGDDIVIGDWTNIKTMPVAADIDGDGINELLIPEYHFSSDGTYFGLHALKGGQIRGNVKYPWLHSTSTDNVLWTAGDYNNDGITEFVVVEKEAVGDSCFGAIMGGYQNPGQPHAAYYKLFKFVSPEEPKHVLSADMNCDGLTDVVAFYDRGYTVFVNDGTWLNGDYTSSYHVPIHKDYELHLNPHKVWQGDFDGDGIPDFLVCVPNSSTFYFEMGKGNNRLQQKVACELSTIYEQSTDNDDNLFFCQVIDIDGDGKSDAIIHKSMFRNYFPYLHDKSYVYWMRSNGNNLVLQSSAYSTQEIEGKQQYYTQGDFNGDGLQEVAAFSFDCYNNPNSSSEVQFRIYNNNTYTNSTGKVTQVTNGFGRQTQITYSKMTRSDVYLEDSGTGDPFFPVIRLSLPLPVVSSVSSGNGAAGQNVKTYKYSKPLVHMQGRGFLGMNKTQTFDTPTGLVTNYTVNGWDTSSLLPTSITETQTLGNQNATTTTSYEIFTLPNGISEIFWHVPSRIESTDFDGKWKREDITYNLGWFAPLHDYVNYGNDVYEMTSYWEYAYKGGKYRPTDIVYTRRNGQGAELYSKNTTYAYNDMGLVDTMTVYAGTDNEVIRTYTYDNYGNQLSETVSANGITPITDTWQYDASHRFVTCYNGGGVTKTTYTHDNWGNTLTETDSTRTAHPTTLSYTYDGWGNLLSSESPLGIRNTYIRGWGNSQTMCYFNVEQGQSQPWKKTWYDAVGREVKTEGINQLGLLTTQTSYYNNKGLVDSVSDITGDITISKSYTYDNRGRCLTSSISDNQNTLNQITTYVYGSNWKSVTKDNRTTKYTYDKWGNTILVTTPQDTISYSYYSSGLPSSVTSCGNTVNMEYDIAGNRTKLIDPDAGTMLYTYDALGRIKTQKNARNQIQSYTYDIYGRKISGPIGGAASVTYTYGTTSANKNLLLSEANGSYKTFYTYDNYGRIINKQCSIPDYGYRTFYYTYNSNDQVASKTYPDGTTLSYQYDAYGNHVKALKGDTVIWQQDSSTGRNTQYHLGSNFLLLETRNAMGMPTAKTLKRNGVTLHNMTFAYNSSTGNLTQRTGMLSTTETFSYDALERLTQVNSSAGSQTITYSADGNILSKTGIGDYSYDNTKPHAVSSVDNVLNIIPDNKQTVNYNGVGKTTHINEYGGLDLSIYYGADGERWKSVCTGGSATKRTLYLDDYEEIRIGQQIKSFCYLDGGVLLMRDFDGSSSLCYTFTDNLGSVTRIYDNSGNELFHATYDAWGYQTLTHNDIGFHRGYTGHEMLPEFGLINMNGRCYDPLLGRFLSTDNYVQEPSNSQNFNRYSYCLNNPLKYTDPSGEIAWLVPIFAGAMIGSALSALTYSASTMITGQNWDSSAFWKAVGLGAFSGALGGAMGFAGHSLGISSIGNNLGYNILSQTTNTIVTNAVFNQSTNFEDVLGVIAGTSVGALFPSNKRIGKNLFANSLKEIGYNTIKGLISGGARGIVDYAIKGNADNVYKDMIGGALSGTSRSLLNNIIFGVPYSTAKIDNTQVTYRTGGLFLNLFMFHGKKGITLGTNASVYNRDRNLENHERFHVFQQLTLHGGWSHFYGRIIYEQINAFFSHEDVYDTYGTLEHEAFEYERMLNNANR